MYLLYKRRETKTIARAQSAELSEVVVEHLAINAFAIVITRILWGSLDPQRFWLQYPCKCCLCYSEGSRRMEGSK